MDDQLMAEFEIWWRGSKYMQVVYSDDNARQIALDGWRAALKAQNDSLMAYVAANAQPRTQRTAHG